MRAEAFRRESTIATPIPSATQPELLQAISGRLRFVLSESSDKIEAVGVFIKIYAFMH